MKNPKSITLYRVNDLLADENLEFTNESLNRATRVSASVLSTQKEIRPKKSSFKGHCKKSRFRDLDEAIEVLHRIQRFRGYAEEAGRDITHRNEQRAYSCPICRGAHLTSKPTLGEALIDAAANISLDISITSSSQSEASTQANQDGTPNLEPVKIRFAAVTSATLSSTKKAV